MQLSSQDGGGGFEVNATECLSETERIEIKKMISENQKRLLKEGKLTESRALVHPLFIWPIKKANSSLFNEVWSISNYVDHNPSYPNQLQDWNCGTRTYDTSGGYNHAGIDIFTWPFGWYQMDYNQAEIVAAAPGVIVAKSNGNFDRSCNFNNNNWNAVYVQHDDGSVAWYGHMKNNSLTTKIVGESVSTGEYLGVVGSSGNSTGPHLHFEVYNSSNQLVDPYQGTCNTWTSSTDSWWQAQKSYEDPKINGIFTHSNNVVLNNGCGVQETTNFKNDFAPGETVFVYIYLSDILAGTPMNLKLIRPDNTVAYNYNFNINTFYAASYWYWTFGSSYFNQNGNWKTTITKGTETVTHNFTYGPTMSTTNVEKQEIIKIVNPVKNNNIELVYAGKSNKKYSVNIVSMDGKTMNQSEISLQSGVNKIPFKQVKGSYIVEISSDDYHKTFKVLNP